MAFGRIVLAWAAVAAWLIAWEWVDEREAGPGRRGRRMAEQAGEALLLTLFGALWFGSLGAGAWWLPFLLVGGLREWPLRSARNVVRIARVMVAGELLVWTLPT